MKRSDAPWLRYIAQRKAEAQRLDDPTYLLALEAEQVRMSPALGEVYRLGEADFTALAPWVLYWGVEGLFQGRSYGVRGWSGFARCWPGCGGSTPNSSSGRGYIGKARWWPPGTC